MSRTILNGKYRLLPREYPSSGQSSVHLAVNEDDDSFLVKLWPFEESDELLYRRLWRVESNNLYRVSSSPGAEELLLVLRDSRVDIENKFFVMILEAMGAGGYDLLSSALKDRKKHEWLQMSDRETRRDLWKSMLNLAKGLSLLHRQHVVHRTFGPENVFLDVETGPDSMRLGGFEWSLRLNYPEGDDPPVSWSTPPEAFEDDSEFGYRPETDWYAFGMLLSRCFLNVEESGTQPISGRHAAVTRELSNAQGRLHELEIDLISRLIALKPAERICDFDFVEPLVNEIVSALGLGLGESVDSRPLVLAINAEKTPELVQRCIDEGFRPDPDNSASEFHPRLHSNRLSSFIQADLVEPKLFPTKQKNSKILVGRRLNYKLRQFRYYDESKQDYVDTWDAAYCYGVGSFWGVDDMSTVKPIPKNGISVRTDKDVRKDRSIRQSCQRWNDFLPVIDRGHGLRRTLGRFYEFVRATNQIELLIRDAEVFAYEKLGTAWIDQRTQTQRVRIKIVRRHRPVFPGFAIEGGAIQYIEKERESGKRFAAHVILTDEKVDGLRLPQEYLDLEPRECWTVYECDKSNETIELTADTPGIKLPEPPEKGYLRSFGMKGQMALIMRRKKAIERLANHTYLLRSLAAPRVMDSGEEPLKHQLDPERDKVDESKQVIMKDILRVRPIYALQGPPGTGKTTLVAHLIRQILEDDPVAQLIITAQAHGAVDVLRAKVTKDAFAGVPENSQPLSVRLGQDMDDDSTVEGSAFGESKKIAATALEQLRQQQTLSDLQQEWVGILESVESTDAATAKGNRDLTELSDLVKRGANLTYCTTSDKGLEQLAESERLFDWSIVEESGKAHGFDLALPLQAGHRWMLLGDQKQLPPYRFRDYGTGIEKLNQVVDWLNGLPNDDRRFIDVEWINLWTERDPDAQNEFKDYARKTLKVFERIYEQCAWVEGVHRITLTRSIGASAGQLTQQYRMHPAIGELISQAYYDGTLDHKTVDESGQPVKEIKHNLSLPKDIGEIEGKAVVWIDLPWCKHDSSFGERGPDSPSPSPRFTNPDEVEAIACFLRHLQSSVPDGQSNDTLAVLSPYNQQVRRLRQNKFIPKFLRAKEASGRRSLEGTIVHSVDSFQGNESSVVVVSLVRNNDQLPGEGLGFLKEDARMNVLFSRAEKLLVLVGSWSFFEHQLRDIDLELHKGNRELWHLKKVLSMLSEWMSDPSGPAVKIPFAALRQES